MAVPELAAEYFDGRSARARPVRLTCVGGALHVDGDDVQLVVPLRDVQWPERTRHGIRVAHLPGGGTLQNADAAAWDAFARACGRGDSLVVRAQQSWRWVLASVAGLALVLAAAYVWGVPWAARAAVAADPNERRRRGRRTRARFARRPPAQAERPARGHPATPARGVRAGRDRATRRRGAAAPHRVPRQRDRPERARVAGRHGGLTDDLVELLDGDAAVITGVLAHEIGHLRHRHGMRLLVQVSAIGVVASAVLGDFSALLTAVPVWLGQAAYARDAEREADEVSATFLKNAGLSPAVMVTFFERIAAAAERRARQADAAASAAAASAPPANETRRRRAPSWLGIAIASHPADAERIRFFQDAATSR